MTAREVHLSTENVLAVMEQMRLLDPDNWTRYAPSLLNAWKESRLYGFLVQVDNKPEKMVPCWCIVNNECRHVVELIWVKPDARRSGCATTLLTLLKIEFVLKQRVNSSQLSLFCRYFPHIKRITSLKETRVQIDLSNENDVKLTFAAFASSTSPKNSAIMDQEEEEEEEEEEKDDYMPVTTQEMIDQKLKELKRDHNVILSRSGNESTRTTVLSGEPLDLIAVNETRHYVHQLIRPRKTYCPYHSNSLRGDVVTWRRKRDKDQRYVLFHGDFIMAMILEGYAFKFREDENDRRSPSLYACYFKCSRVSDSHETDEEEEGEMFVEKR